MLQQCDFTLKSNLLVLGLSAEESECEGTLDVIVTVDRRPDGGDDPLADALVLKVNSG